MSDLTPEELAEWRKDAENATYYGGNEQEQADRILALLDALADAELRGAVAALREAVDLIAGGPAYRLPPSVIIALLRERADHIEGEIRG